MANYSIVTDKTLKTFLQTILSTYIVPNMKKINDDELSSYYKTAKQSFQNLLVETKQLQQDN